MGFPPGSPYAVDLGRMITTMFSAMSPAHFLRFTGTPVHPIKHSISDPNAVGCAPQARPSRPLVVLIRLELAILTRL